MKNFNWIVLRGQAKIGETILYSNKKDTFGTILKCNQSFIGGIISFNVTLNPDPNKREPLMLSVVLNDGSEKPNLHVSVTSHGEFLIAQHSPNDWVRLASTGADPSRKEQVTYDIRIEVTGSQVSFIVNGVKVCQSNQAQLALSQVMLAFEGEGDITVKNFDIEANKLKAFIIMKFGEQYDYVYSEVIKPVCSEMNIECYRADEFSFPGTILKDIITSIVDSDIIIADITPDNPNVYFEVGYAYALGKNPILLMDKKQREHIPFDVSGFRVIMYNNTIEGATLVRELLTKYLAEFIK